MFIIGLDFGMKFIGVACGQTITKTASPLTCLKAHNGIPRWEELDKIIHNWRPIEIVIGLPLNMDGTKQYLTFCANKFANRVYNRYKLPIHLVDERLSSWEAKKRSNIKKINDFNHINAVAAAILVEQWLNNK